jgi:hypothetical protein
MGSSYTYQFWDGRKFIGSYTTQFPIVGKAMMFPSIAPLKELYYGKKYETIEVPIAYLTEDNGVSYTTTRVLDVRRKSKRQREILLGFQKD